MKRLTLLLLALTVGLGTMFAQEADTSKVRIGKKKYTIIVDDDKDIQIITDDGDYEYEDNIIIREKKKKKQRRMDGTWGGLEFGLTNFVNTDYALDLPADGSFMELDLPTSWGINLNFAEKSLGLINNYVGIVTGAGLEYNRYMLSNNVKLAEVDGMMTGAPVDMELSKNRLSMTYFNVPLLAEFQIPVYGEHNRIKLSAGVVGGVRLFSRQVQKYEMNGEKQKNKAKDNFNLRPYRYGFTARVAYGDLALFANYYPQTLFDEGMGPDIFPVTVGLHFGEN